MIIIIISLSTTCSYIIHSPHPDGLVEPVAVENGTYLKYDVVDVARSGRGFMLFDDSNVVFGVSIELLNGRHQHYRINMHVTNLSLSYQYLLSIMPKNN